MSRHLMACLSWSPLSLPGGLIGAREQPHRGPNNEEPTVGPALAARSDLEVRRCSVDGAGGSTQHGVCVIDDGGVVVKRWLVRHAEDELRVLFAELATWPIRQCCRSRSNAVRA